MAMSVKILFGNEMEVKLMTKKNKIKQTKSLEIIIGLNWMEVLLHLTLSVKRDCEKLAKITFLKLN